MFHARSMGGHSGMEVGGEEHLFNIEKLRPPSDLECNHQLVNVVNKLGLQQRLADHNTVTAEPVHELFFVRRLEGTVCTLTEWCDVLSIIIALDLFSFSSSFSINQTSKRSTFCGGRHLEHYSHGIFPQRPLQRNPVSCVNNDQSFTLLRWILRTSCESPVEGVTGRLRSCVLPHT